MDLPEFVEIARSINEALEFNGAWFFQLKRASDGSLALLEVATRLAGASAVHRALGVNFPVLSYFNQLKMSVRVDPNEFEITLERAWSNRYRAGIAYRHVYVDFDDCLWFEGRVNARLVGFLYQCLNAGKRLHLLTRHAGRLSDRLAELRLGSLFDTCIVIGRSEKKSDSIKERDAIFIDDSFAERVGSPCGPRDSGILRRRDRVPP